MGDRVILEIFTEDGITKLIIGKEIKDRLGIENFADVMVMDGLVTGALYIFSGSRMAEEIERKEQLRSKE